MTPPEHIAVAATAANLAYALRPVPRRYLVLLAVCCGAAVFPDIDAFTGVYTSPDPWIGHRGMTHSAAASMLFAALLSIIAALLRLPSFLARKRMTFSADVQTARRKTVFAYVFVYALLGGLSHCMADMPQPPGYWNGIPFLFPLMSGGEYIRFGGWGCIGWFDIRLFWLFSAAALLSAVLIGLMKAFTRSGRYMVSLRLLAAFVASASIIWGSILIAGSEYENPAAWRKYQTDIVGSAPAPVKKITFAVLQAGQTAFIESRKKRPH